MRTYWLHYLLNLVVPLALIFFAWGCGGVALQVDAPRKTPPPAKTRKPLPTPIPTAKPVKAGAPRGSRLMLDPYSHTALV
ncbi:hypothetical protein J7643_17365 [bacterium]|nr:hypothetical protein [bacterium]